MKKYIFLAAVFVFLSGCSSAPKIERVDANTVRDVSGFWNDTDVRIVCKAFIDDFSRSPRVNNALLHVKGKTPKMIIGSFYNDSSEHIDTSIISIIMEEAIFNSGKLDVVVGGRDRAELRKERLDQNQGGFTSESTAKKLANETGADFVLAGSVKTIVDSYENRAVRTYFVNARIIDLETNQLVWTKMNNDIKKDVKRPKARL